jgi:hypothetical protein
VPQNKPFPDMTVEETERILAAAFDVCDHITTLHLTGGGEPFLHPHLPELVECSMKYADKFDRLMLFTNCTIVPSAELCETLKRHKSKLLVQVSRYGVSPSRETEVLSALEATGVTLKIEKYYGDDQSFGGWVDFGSWESYNRTPDELERTFKNCAVTRDMQGNWRTRDGKVHWCTRSQRGMELELLPDNPDEYVDLLDDSSVEAKRAKFDAIAVSRHISACDRCSGDQGTSDKSKRFQAAEQECKTHKTEDI